MKKILLTIIALGIFGVVAFGQITPGADKRQKNQKHRVKTGVKSGEITKREAKSIKHSTKSAKRYEAKAKSDGKVTWKERARLQHKENKSSRKIYRTKHNKRDRN
jgi:Ni/Co efflux regulator RcnB